MNNEKCPCCSNHCFKDHLGCERGEEYFKNQSSYEPKSLEEKIIKNLRECGHFLHHNKEFNFSRLLSNFSEDELNNLYQLLSKIIDNQKK